MITVERAKAAVEKNGVPLIQGGWMRKENYKTIFHKDSPSTIVGYTFDVCGACVISQVILAESGLSPVEYNDKLEEAVNSEPSNGDIFDCVAGLIDLPADYIRGFVNSFDGCRIMSDAKEAFDRGVNAHEDYMQGVDHGRAIREELLK